MDKTRITNFFIFKGIRRAAKWFARWTYIILAACMIGFTNAYYDENRMINDTRNFVRQEQVIDDEDTNK
jgi:hypothetical protein